MPLVTVIALSYATLLEGSVLTETVFSWPGIGLYLTNSLQNADMNAVLGATDHHRRRVHRPQPARPTCSTGCSTRGRGHERRRPIQDGLARLAAVGRPQSRAQAGFGRAYMTWRRFAANRLAVVGLAIILALVLVAILANVIAPYSPIEGDVRTMRLLPPSAGIRWEPTTSAATSSAV